MGKNTDRLLAEYNQKQLMVIHILSRIAGYRCFLHLILLPNFTNYSSLQEYYTSIFVLPFLYLMQFMNFPFSS